MQQWMQGKKEQSHTHFTKLWLNQIVVASLYIYKYTQLVKAR